MNAMKRDSIDRATGVALRHSGAPRWGLACDGASITEAAGLGWHRAATLWRKTESRTANGNVQSTLDEGAAENVGSSGFGSATGADLTRLPSRSPEGTTLCQPRPTAWGHITRQNRPAPTGAALPNANERDETRFDRLGDRRCAPPFRSAPLGLGVRRRIHHPGRWPGLA